MAITSTLVSEVCCRTKSPEDRAFGTVTRVMVGTSARTLSKPGVHAELADPVAVAVTMKLFVPVLRLTLRDQSTIPAVNCTKLTAGFSSGSITLSLSASLYTRTQLPDWVVPTMVYDALLVVTKLFGVVTVGCAGAVAIRKLFPVEVALSIMIAVV